MTRRGNGVNRFRIVPEPARDRSHLWGALKGRIPDDTDYGAADRAMAGSAMNPSGPASENTSRHHCAGVAQYGVRMIDARA